MPQAEAPAVSPEKYPEPRVAPKGVSIDSIFIDRKYAQARKWVEEEGLKLLDRWDPKTLSNPDTFRLLVALAYKKGFSSAWGKPVLEQRREFFYGLNALHAIQFDRLAKGKTPAQLEKFAEKLASNYWIDDSSTPYHVAAFLDLLPPKTTPRQMLELAVEYGKLQSSLRGIREDVSDHLFDSTLASKLGPGLTLRLLQTISRAFDAAEDKYWTYLQTLLAEYDLRDPVLKLSPKQITAFCDAFDYVLGKAREMKDARLAVRDLSDWMFSFAKNPSMNPAWLSRDNLDKLAQLYSLRAGQADLELKYLPANQGLSSLTPAQFSKLLDFLIHLAQSSRKDSDIFDKETDFVNELFRTKGFTYQHFEKYALPFFDAVASKTSRTKESAKAAADIFGAAKDIFFGVNWTGKAANPDLLLEALLSTAMQNSLETTRCSFRFYQRFLDNNDHKLELLSPELASKFTRLANRISRETAGEAFENTLDLAARIVGNKSFSISWLSEENIGKLIASGPSNKRLEVTDRYFMQPLENLAANPSFQFSWLSAENTGILSSLSQEMSDCYDREAACDALKRILESQRLASFKPAELTLFLASLESAFRNARHETKLDIMLAFDSFLSNPAFDSIKGELLKPEAGRKTAAVANGLHASFESFKEKRVEKGERWEKPYAWYDNSKYIRQYPIHNLVLTGFFGNPGFSEKSLSTLEASLRPLGKPLKQFVDSCEKLGMQQKSTNAILATIFTDERVAKNPALALQDANKALESYKGFPKESLNPLIEKLVEFTAQPESAKILLSSYERLSRSLGKATALPEPGFISLMQYYSSLAKGFEETFSRLAKESTPLSQQQFFDLLMVSQATKIMPEGGFKHVYSIYNSLPEGTRLSLDQAILLNVVADIGLSDILKKFKVDMDIQDPKNIEKNRLELNKINPIFGDRFVFLATQNLIYSTQSLKDINTALSYAEWFAKEPSENQDVNRFYSGLSRFISNRVAEIIQLQRKEFYASAATESVKQRLAKLQIELPETESGVRKFLKYVKAGQTGLALKKAALKTYQKIAPLRAICRFSQETMLSEKNLKELPIEMPGGSHAFKVLIPGYEGIEAKLIKCPKDKTGVGFAAKAGGGASIPSGLGLIVDAVGAYTTGDRKLTDFGAGRGDIKNYFISDREGFLVIDAKGKAEIITLSDVVGNYSVDAMSKFMERVKKESLSVMQQHLLLHKGGIMVSPTNSSPNIEHRRLFMIFDDSYAILDIQGVTLYEAAFIAQKLGAKDAVNLDTGMYDYSAYYGKDGKPTYLGIQDKTGASNMVYLYAK